MGRTQSQLVPELSAGLTRLHRPSPRSTALHQLVASELAPGGETLWIDARNNASTHALYELAPNRRVLDGVRIARAFTAYQHHELVRGVARRAGPETSLVVAPCLASLYADDDVPEREGRDLLAASVSILSELGRALDVPVLATAEGDGGEVVAEHADAEVECTRTDLGFRYETEGFETLVYASDGYWQTTIPYWVELLGAVGEHEPFAAGAPEFAVGV